MAGTPIGCSALPASALVTARPKRTSGHAVNAELDLKLICSFGTSLGVRKQRLPTLATFAVLGVRFGARRPVPMHSPRIGSNLPAPG